MPYDRKLTPEEEDYVRQQGGDPTGATVTMSGDSTDDNGKMSALGAVAARLKANVGGDIGGGVGAIGAGMAMKTLLSLAAAPETGGASLLPLAATLIAQAGAGVAGAWAGAKAQDALLGDVTTQHLQEQAAQAEEQHPIVSGATDIGAAMLASGGRPGLKTLTGAIEGVPGARASLAINAAVNPAINSGIDYATTGQLPNAKNLLAQAAGGLVTDQAKWAGRLSGHGVEEKPASIPDTTGEQQQESSTQSVPSPYTMKEGNDHLISDDIIKDRFKKSINPKPDPKSFDNISDYDIARSKWRQIDELPVQDKRDMLHDFWLQNQIDKTSDNTTGLKMQEDVTNPTPTGMPVEEVKNAPAPAPAPTEEPSQRMLDYIKAQLEESRSIPIEHAPAEEQSIPIQGNGTKPITENQAKIINPTTLLQSNVSRPESFDRNSYAPPKNEYERNQSKMQEMIRAGDVDSPEFRDLWKKSEMIKNKNSGMPPLDTVVRNGTNVGEVLKHIAQSDSDFAPLAKSHLEKADSEKLKIPIVAPEGEGRSNYDSANRIISMQPEDAGNHRWLMHEIGHALTLGHLPDEFFNLRGAKLKVAMDKYLREGSNPHVKELISSYYEAAKNLGIHDELFTDNTSTLRQNKVEGLAGKPDLAHATGMPHGYAMGNLQEFISELMSNKKFSQHLNEMPSGLNNKESLLSRIYTSVKKLLGVDVKSGSLLERALKPAHELIGMREGEESSSGKSFAPPNKNKDIPEAKFIKGTDRLMRDTISKVALINHPEAKEISKGGAKALQEIPERLGRTAYPLVQEGKSKLTAEDKVAINKIREYGNINGTKPPASMFTSQAVKDYYDLNRKIHTEEGKDQIASNEPVIDAKGLPRQLVMLPHSTGMVPSQKVIEVLHANNDAAALKDIHDKFVNNLVDNYNHTPKQAESAYENFKSATQGNLTNQAPNLQNFNAVRRAHGSPLPLSLAESDPVINDERYYRRRAVDRAFWNNIESNKKIMGALGGKKDVWGRNIPQSEQGSLANNEDVRNMLSEFHGEKGGPAFHAENAWSALATTALVSNPGIEIHKLGTNTLGTLLKFSDNPQQLVRVASAMLTNFKEGLQHATENGVVKVTARSAKTLLNSNATMSERMQSLAATMRGVSNGFGLLDKVNAGLMQAGAEAGLPLKIDKANNGSVSDQQIIKKIDPDYTVGKTYSKDEIQKLASRSVAFIHGTGDGRTLPSWMAKDTEFSGFFKLAHWSVAQTNRFMTEIYTPATRGEYGPLLTTMFGSAVGGYMIKQLREELQGRQGQIPSLSEIAASEGGLSEHKSLVAYNMIAGAQYAGFAGLLSQIARYPFDAAYKNSPQGAVFPLDEIAVDLAKTTTEVTSAIANDSNINWLDLATHVASHLLTSNVQMAKVVANNMINEGLITGDMAEHKLTEDKKGQLRRFEEIQGLPYSEQESGGNQYANLESKKFRTTQNIQEAVKLLPGLISKIVDENRNNPDVMQEKLNGLKEHSYATFPSMENMPLQFMKYVAYLNKVEGSEEAHKAMQDYMSHQIIGEAKASLVP